MDVRMNLPIVGIAGTGRAQAKGSDSDRPAPGGGVAESQKSLDNLEIHHGSSTKDRDADGRLLDDHQSQQQQKTDSDDSDDHSASKRSHDQSATEGQHLDFDA